MGLLAMAVVQVCTAQTLDLVQVWERARQADPQMAAAQATRSTWCAVGLVARGEAVATVAAGPRSTAGTASTGRATED